MNLEWRSQDRVVEIKAHYPSQFIFGLYDQRVDLILAGDRANLMLGPQKHPTIPSSSYHIATALAGDGGQSYVPEQSIEDQGIIYRNQYHERFCSILIWALYLFIYVKSG